MLFSSREVADYINANYEPAWESVRPAPLVTVDFGNGHIVKRTLQGNIATYACDSDGTVYDVLPGIYTPSIYRRELEACRVLVQALRPRLGPTPTTEAGRRRVAWDLSDRLRRYHTRQFTQVETFPLPTPAMKIVAQTGGGFKGMGSGVSWNDGFAGKNFGGGFGGGFGGIEGPTQRVIMGLPSPTLPGVVPSGPLAARPELALDAEVNERIRRQAIHTRLARSGVVRPDDIKKWLFKDVLHTDIDDPLLGLGPVLNANYPFLEEDRANGVKQGER